jgi:protein-L-isoaspartate(D-aspartate) O-methyltransferase
MSRLKERKAMVAEQIAGRGVRDPRVLAAMASVPRELFVPREQSADAYLDQPLPIGEGQTISQPYVVGLMLEALCLEGGERMLEVGAGSGYATAVASQIAGQVYAIERIEGLAHFARKNLQRAGCANVELHCADGSLGWPQAAPFDAILVSAGGPAVPETLKAQLAVGGRLVMPAGRERRAQRLLRVTRRDAQHFELEDLGGVFFVPLIGEGGWQEED